VHLGRVEQAPEVLLVAAGEAGGGVEDLGPAAVVEGDEQCDAVVGASALSICSSRAPETRSRRPMNRMRTPSASSSGVSRRMRSENMRMSAVTSSAGRDQFSVEKE
jgi:hypothetical protein